MPILTVIAGPNGSGKSTLIEMLMEKNINLGTYINADEIAKAANLTGEFGSLEAQRRADAMRAACLESGVDFSFETVMSHPSKVEFMQAARKAGYKVVLYFVCTESPEINVRRVRKRVIFGGHDVPVERILARYYRTLDLLPKAVSTADRSVLFNNSQNYESISKIPLIVAEVLQSADGKFSIKMNPDLPDWCRPALLEIGAKLPLS